MTQISSTAFSTPITFARGRNGDVYGVTGKERGFRWESGTAEQLGISAPTTAPSMTYNTSDALYYLAGIDVLDGGQGYTTEPTVYIGGGGTTTKSVTGTENNNTVLAEAHGLSNGNAIRFESLTGGKGLYTHRTYYVVNTAANSFQVANTPAGSAINFTTDIDSATVRVPASTLGIAKASVRFGQVNDITLLKYGIGYAATPSVHCDPPAQQPAPGSGADLSANIGTIIDGDMAWTTVTDVTINNGGSGYFGRPRVQFSGGNGAGAIAEVDVDGNGAISAVRVLSGGQYEEAPTVTIVNDWSETNRAASLSPVLKPAIKGKYWCAFRYIDDTTAARGGPIPSSITELTAIEVTEAAGKLVWSLTTTDKEARVDKIELWRTTADQVTVLYRVATVAKNTTTYNDLLSDAELADPERSGFEVMPIVLPNGQANARRFNPPPQNKAVIAMFQDRAWYGVDVAGRKFNGVSDTSYAEPNTLYFSEQDEPESVPEYNELIIQENVKGQDRITALMPFGGGMVVFQERHSYRLTFVSQPLIDANIMLIGQRGCLNQRCWDVYDGVAYVVDSMGMYMLDGSNAVPLSDAVDTYWTDNVIHFASSKWFFVRVDPVTRIARFFFSVSSGHPDRALCFHPITKAWWEERYAQTFAAMECMTTGGRQAVIAGGQTGSFYKFDSGHQDINSASANVGIACSLRTGNYPFTNESSRGIRVLFKPTTDDCSLNLALHYNGSATARNAAVRTDRGTGFTTEAAQSATLNLKLARSALGDATGYAVCSYVGRIDDKSSGGDRHLAIALSLTRPSAEAVTIYGLGVEGIGQ